MKSDAIKKGIERAPHRSLLFATGVTRKALERPLIGVASSFSDLVPGHTAMRDLERYIEKGIHSGGGYAAFFGTPAVCDGIAMGHSGMKYSLPSRELIADCVETMARANAYDGMVLLTDCDKITPGMLMAAMRVNIPCVWWSQQAPCSPGATNRCVGILFATPLSQWAWSRQAK